MCGGFSVTPLEFLILGVLMSCVGFIGALAVWIAIRGAYRRLKQANPVGALMAVCLARLGLGVVVIVLIVGASMNHESDRPQLMADCVSAPQ